ncbi:hypothetical protein JW752_02170 [Candidatus Peregrinibacteria bacterium]|nr:hypothetical protein [Candidatus Peregrinibacteria bacterium]
MRKRFSRLNQLEKIIVVFLASVVLITGTQIGYAFYNEYSEITPVKGGVYVEGAVGKVELINPLYVHYGSLTHDLTQLVFSGLTKYDPKTREVVPDLADYTISDNGKKYTFVLKEGAKWHDGTPVTSRDVMFTYNTVINHPSFNGVILNYNDFSGMKVSQVDDRTVEFLLENPDSFFLVKTITGLLPAHILGHLPVETLEQAPFNQYPIGTGPYRFMSLASMDDFVEVTLEAFDDYYGEESNISTIQIRIFPEYKDLIKRQGEFDAIRNVPEEYVDKIRDRGRLALTRYYLPQYVAVFINTQSPQLKNNKVRLALQLGTDKKSLVQEIGQNQIIDTPLLEIDQSNWVYQYNVNKANGALFDTEWKLPDKQPEADETEEVPEENAKEDETDKENTGSETKEPEFITSPNGGNDWKTTDKKVTVAGITPEKTKAIIVNDYELKKFVPGDPGWSYVASFEFGNLKKGDNIFDVYAIDFNEEKNLIDSITVTQGTAEEFIEQEREVAKQENEVAEVLPFRENTKGEKLILHLIAPDKPETYTKVAEILKQQWRKIGIGLKIDVLENSAFQEALFKRDYDLLIFGQNLGYNLDAYPYWHSSQAKEGGYNLSQFKNFVVDSLLDKARLELDDEDRKKTLNDIQEIISQEVPAIFLYSPTYYFALSDKIQNASFENLATASDRFARIAEWYGRVDRQLKDGVNPLTFAAWLIKQF